MTVLTYFRQQLKDPVRKDPPSERGLAVTDFPWPFPCVGWGLWLTHTIATPPLYDVPPGGWPWFERHPNSLRISPCGITAGGSLSGTYHAPKDLRANLLYGWVNGCEVWTTHGPLGHGCTGAHDSLYNLFGAERNPLLRFAGIFQGNDETHHIPCSLSTRSPILPPEEWHARNVKYPEAWRMAPVLVGCGNEFVALRVCWGTGGISLWSCELDGTPVEKIHQKRRSQWKIFTNPS